MILQSIPHIKDTYSGFKLEQIYFPRDSGHCIASFWENKNSNNKKLADIASLRDPGKQKRTLGCLIHETPWVRQERLGSSHLSSVLFPTRGWENCKSREPMELYRLAPWKIDGFLFRVPKLRLSPSQMG